MLRPLKKLLSRMPSRWQLALRRCWHTCQFCCGSFTHDEPEFARLSEWVSPGDCVLDIGANIGTFTAAMSKLVGPHGHVFAFEPIPDTFHMLAFNTRLFAYPNVTLLNVAASDESALVGMEVPTSDTGLPDIYLAHIVDTPTGTRSFAVPVDDLTIPGPVSFVKIDVEGHEYAVLRGMEKLLRDHSPTLVVEGNDPAVTEFLNLLGYSGTTMSGSPNTIFQCISETALVPESTLAAV